MRQIEVEPGLNVRFPHREEAFDEGLEVGLLAAMMCQGVVRFTRTVAASSVAQIEALAKPLGYRVVADVAGERAEVVLCSTALRPRLRLVNTAG
jgi:hypothetical protein